MNRKLYKVLVNGQSCHGGSMEWSLPTKNPATGKYRPGAWQHVNGNVSMCSRGLHLTDKPEKWLKVGCKIFRAQTQECPTTWQDDKCVVAGARLLYPIRKPAYWTKVEEFCASINGVPFFKPDGKPDPEWKLFTAPTWAAARAAAWAASLLGCVLTCDGLPLDQKHIDHAKARWRVWSKGYGLLCDVNGVLYVYAAKASK